jgi:hypothetical protein
MRTKLGIIENTPELQLGLAMVADKDMVHCERNPKA